MKPSGMHEAGRWLAQARQDLSDALYNRAGDRHHLACFLAQQAAEKALKAYLYSREMEAPWGHSARVLSGAAAEFDAAFAKVQKKAADLDKYYIPTRYPNGLPGGLPADAFDESDSARALGDSEQILGLVERLLPAD